MNDLLSEWNDEHPLSNGNEDWKTIPGIPAFQNPEIQYLYAWGFDIPVTAVKKILALPLEALIADLELVLQDAELRYPAYFEREEAGKEPLPLSMISFPVHAIFLLAELKSTNSLGKVCRFLGKNSEMVDYWLAEHLTQNLWMALFKLGKDNLERLQKFARNQDADWRARAATTSAVAQVAWHYSGRRKEVFAWFEAFLAIISKNSKMMTMPCCLGRQSLTWPTFAHLICSIPSKACSMKTSWKPQLADPLLKFRVTCTNL
mgnify:CR=1 FL=1